MDKPVSVLSKEATRVIPDRLPLRVRDILLRWEVLLVVLLVGVVVVNSSLSPYFLDLYNLADSTVNFSEKALIVLSMTLVILCRDIDLSVASIIALASVGVGLAHQAGVPGEVLPLVGIAIGVLAGGLNGWIVTRFAVPSIVVTIGTMSLYRGIAYVVLGDEAFTRYPAEFLFWGQHYAFGLIPLEFLIFLGFAVLFGMVLHGTIIGRHLYAIGNNPLAARFTGIPVDRYRLALFMVSGFMSGLAAVLLTGRIGSTRPNIAMAWELEVVTVVVLGGVSIMGGSGTILGVVLAVFLMGMVTFGLGLMNVPGIVMTIFIGGLLIVSIALPLVVQRFTSRN